MGAILSAVSAENHMGAEVLEMPESINYALIIQDTNERDISNFYFISCAVVTISGIN